jgi:hypothetical protein
MYLGHAPPADDPLPTVPRKLAVLVAEAGDRPLAVRVRTPAELRVWLAAARPGDRAVYLISDEPLISARERDRALAVLADEALKQSNARDVPLRSACRHIRGRLNGLDRVRLHAEPLPLGLGTRLYAVRLGDPPPKRRG